MHIRTLGDFARFLESVGELRRVPFEVDPYLEVTEVARRAIREKKPALWFERVKGARYPLVVNTLAGGFRCELALGRHPEEVGEELVRFAEDLLPPRASALTGHRSVLWRLVRAAPRRVHKASSQEVIESPELFDLPLLTCWPSDCGRSLPFSQAVTEDPRTGRRGTGMCRMQVFDGRTTGIRWQVQAPCVLHHARAETDRLELPVAAVLGAHPALLFAAASPLPDSVDQVLFAGYLRGRGFPFVRGSSIPLAVPAEAEFILEGTLSPGERRMEGPFADGSGRTGAASEAPVFRLKAVTRRHRPVCPGRVAGLPPMEEKWLGEAVQMMLGPLVRLVHTEVSDLWAYSETGFRNLVVAAVEERHAGDALKAACGLLGMRGLSLTRCLVLVSRGVNVRNIDEVMKNIRDHFEASRDFHLTAGLPPDAGEGRIGLMDTGSRMILDATVKRSGAGEERPAVDRKRREEQVRNLRALDPRIMEIALVHDTLLLVKVNGGGMGVVERLVRHTELPGVKIAAAVSEDVDLSDSESYLWGIFTRFDCARDLVFTEQRLQGPAPVVRGIMGIDATWKPGLPAPLRMGEEVRKKVDDRWGDYWKGSA
ncbi:MAG: UbiD family decarboxylase [Bacteroidota bacterium]